jgi:hypothetical protein
MAFTALLMLIGMAVVGRPCWVVSGCDMDIVTGAMAPWATTAVAAAGWAPVEDIWAMAGTETEATGVPVAATPVTDTVLSELTVVTRPLQ